MIDTRLKSLWLLSVLATASPIGAAANAGEVTLIPFTADRWDVNTGAEFSQREGFQNGALTLKAARVTLKDLQFDSGTIEYDVKPTGGFAGITFRRVDADTSEEFYIRPGPDCPASQDCIQYTPQTHGVMMWDSFPDYQAPAPIRPNEWNHIRIVISGQRMNVFVNGLSKPSLEVGRLEGDAPKGSVQLWGSGVFANLTIAAGVVDGLAPAPITDATQSDPGYLRDWLASPAVALPTGPDPVHSGPDPKLADMPADTAPWRQVAAERRGLVNLDRLYGSPTPPSVRALVWLKTHIDSDQAQTKQVAIGWAREIWIYVNGQQVFSGANLYKPEASRRYPDGRLSILNGSFDLSLKKGRNEIAVALDNNMPDDATHYDKHYGWGLEMRLNDVQGVKLTEAHSG